MDLFVADDNGANDMWQRLVPPDRIEGENIAADDAIREDCEAKDPSFFTVNQTLMEKSMKEFEEHIHFYGINEQGCEVDIAYNRGYGKRVHDIRERTKVPKPITEGQIVYNMYGPLRPRP